MGIPDIEAEHLTLALANAIPRVEVQLPDSTSSDSINWRGGKTGDSAPRGAPLQ
jgi:hypothetical protein